MLMHLDAINREKNKKCFKKKNLLVNFTNMKYLSFIRISNRIIYRDFPTTQNTLTILTWC